MIGLRNPSVWALNALLALQGGGFYFLSRPEQPRSAARLAQFPREIGGWRMERQWEMDQETRDVLQPDDSLIREYRQPSFGAAANLFIAYYRSQRGGRVPHSPRNCLPAQGWTSTRGGTVSIPIPGGNTAINVNRYLVARGEDQAVVLYWYQTATRSVAGEYLAGLYQILDSIRYNRSDTALVRVVVPVEFADEVAVQRAATEFVQAVYPSIREIW